MNRFLKWILVVVFLLAVVGCLVFIFGNLHALMKVDPAPSSVDYFEDVNHTNEEIESNCGMPPGKGCVLSGKNERGFLWGSW
jgi:hypothetical protein